MILLYCHCNNFIIYAWNHCILSKHTSVYMRVGKPAVVFYGDPWTTGDDHGRKRISSNITRSSTVGRTGTYSKGSVVSRRTVKRCKHKSRIVTAGVVRARVVNVIQRARRRVWAMCTFEAIIHKLLFDKTVNIALSDACSSAEAELEGWRCGSVARDCRHEGRARFRAPRGKI